MEMNGIMVNHGLLPPGQCTETTAIPDSRLATVNFSWLQTFPSLLRVYLSVLGSLSGGEETLTNNTASCYRNQQYILRANRNERQSPFITASKACPISSWRTLSDWVLWPSETVLMKSQNLPSCHAVKQVTFKKRKNREESVSQGKMARRKIKLFQLQGICWFLQSPSAPTKPIKAKWLLIFL